MERVHHGTPRTAWEVQVFNRGLIFNKTLTPDGRVVQYWREGPHYSITSAEQQVLEAASRAMHQMCIAAGDYMVAHPDVMKRMGIPESAFAEIIRTWDEEPPSVYGRFDWRFGANDEMALADPSLLVPKLLEYNADTPTSLLEASVIQWDWFEQAQHAGKDQWNNLHDALIAAWKRQIEDYERKTGQKVRKIHFVHTAEDTSGEDWMNTTYMADTAQQAGYEVKVFYSENLQKRVSHDDGSFHYRDPDGEYIQVLFKLYPWEAMTVPALAPNLSPTLPNGTVWIEPPYKQLWSNKGLLPVLWELFKNDPEKSQYLLPAYFEGDQPADLTNYVIKPLLSREGANVRVYENGELVLSTGGEYGKEGNVVQAFAPLPNFQSPYTGENNHPVLGVWMIDGEPQAMGIREGGLITDNVSHFAPHVITN